MNRGTLILTNQELQDLHSYVNFEKLNIALENIREENRVFLNEDELESILDEIGGITDIDSIKNIKEKISTLLLSFR